MLCYFSHVNEVLTLCSMASVQKASFKGSLMLPILSFAYLSVINIKNVFHFSMALSKWEILYIPDKHHALAAEEPEYNSLM